MTTRQSVPDVTVWLEIVTTSAPVLEAEVVVPRILIAIEILHLTSSTDPMIYSLSGR
jgi:hypothetical protein